MCEIEQAYVQVFPRAGFGTHSNPVRIITPEGLPLALAIRDFLNRQGMPHRSYLPDSPQGREALERLDGPPSYSRAFNHEISDV